MCQCSCFWTLIFNVIWNHIPQCEMWLVALKIQHLKCDIKVTPFWALVSRYNQTGSPSFSCGSTRFDPLHIWDGTSSLWGLSSGLDVLLRIWHNFEHILLYLELPFKSVSEIPLMRPHRLYLKYTCWRGEGVGRMDVQGSSFLHLYYQGTRVSVRSHKYRVINHNLFIYLGFYVAFNKFV